MNKIGVLDPAFVDLDDQSCDIAQVDDIVQVVIGNATPVFNNLNESEEYYLFVKDVSGYLVASVAKNQNRDIESDKMGFNEITRSDKNDNNDSKENVKIELWKYYSPNGPPTVC